MVPTRAITAERSSQFAKPVAAHSRMEAPTRTLRNVEKHNLCPRPRATARPSTFFATGREVELPRRHVASAASTPAGLDRFSKNDDNAGTSPKVEITAEERVSLKKC